MTGTLPPAGRGADVADPRLCARRAGGRGWGQPPPAAGVGRALPCIAPTRRRVSNAHGGAIDLERHDRLRADDGAGQAAHGHRVEDRALPRGPPRRRREGRAPALLLQGGQGGPLQGRGQGLRGGRGRIRRARQGGGRGGGRRRRAPHRRRALRRRRGDRSRLLRPDVLPRRGQGRCPALPPAARRARADRPRRDRPLHLPRPRVPHRGARPRRRARAAHAALRRRARAGRRRRRRRAEPRPGRPRGQDGRAAHRHAPPALQARSLRGRVPRRGARRGRAQGQGRGARARRRARGGRRPGRPHGGPAGQPRGREEGRALMARSLWTGSISFGLVNVPVALYSAFRDLDVHFRQLHEKDGAPIDTRRFCSEEDKEVPFEAIGHGYEMDDGEQVVLTDDDLAAAAPRKTRTIDIEAFVDIDDVDPIYFDHPYFLAPVGEAEGNLRAYKLLVKVMQSTDRAALGRFVLRSKEYLVLVRVRDDRLALTTMLFHDEVRRAKDVDRGGRKPAKAQLDAAKALIEALSVDWDPSRYADCYRERLLDVIERKRKGKRIAAPPAGGDAGGPPPDIMAALKESLERARSGEGFEPRDGNGDGDGDGGSNRDDAHEDLSRDELYERAQKDD